SSCRHTLRTPPRPPLFPYTTLFRSVGVRAWLRLGRCVHDELADLGPDIAGSKAVVVVLALVVVPCAITIAQIGNDVTAQDRQARSEEHTSELQSRSDLVCRLLLEKK